MVDIDCGAESDFEELRRIREHLVKKQMPVTIRGSGIKWYCSLPIHKIKLSQKIKYNTIFRST